MVYECIQECGYFAFLVSSERLANPGLPSLVKEATVAFFTKEVNPLVAKRPLKTNGRLANRD